MSLWHIAQALRRTRTSPGPGEANSTHSMDRGLPNSRQTAAFTVFFCIRSTGPPGPQHQRIHPRWVHTSAFKTITVFGRRGYQRLTKTDSKPAHHMQFKVIPPRHPGNVYRHMMHGGVRTRPYNKDLWMQV